MIYMKDITKTYRVGPIRVEALRGIDMAVASGEMVSIMGPSGSGKSTLMNVIGCLDQPSSGIYQLDGVDVGKLNDNQLADIRNRKIGFVFQNYNLLPRTSALANVELPLVYSGVKDRKQRAREALERVGLADRAGHKPSELSGGQQQRVCIARALVTRPAIILADEPTGNLDTTTGLEIMNIFTELNRTDGITIVMVTHEPEIAEYSRYVIYIRDGKAGRAEALNT